VSVSSISLKLYIKICKSIVVSEKMQENAWISRRLRLLTKNRTKLLIIMLIIMCPGIAFNSFFFQFRRETKHFQ